MNGFLWLGIVSGLVLFGTIVLGGLDEGFDALDWGPDWLSLPAVAAFVSAFGFGTGAFSDGIGGAAVLPGLAAGAGFGWAAVRLARAADTQPTQRTDRARDLLGSLGHIVTPPTAERVGEVLLDRPAGPIKVACSAAQPLPLGAEVVVVDVASSTLVTVEPFDSDGRDS